MDQSENRGDICRSFRRARRPEEEMVPSSVANRMVGLAVDT